MKTWRVGSFSMGITLILLGVVLVASNWLNVSMYDLFMSWWPFLLIIVGTEMLVYLKKRDDEDARIKYDFLSIFFVGIIGTIALSFMFLSVSGLMEEFRYSIGHKTETTQNLPSYSEEVAGRYERVVVEADGQDLNIEASEHDAVEVFGTYQTINEEMVVTKIEDYLQTHIKGGTLYISLKALPTVKGLYNYQPEVRPTLLIPNELELEVRGQNYNGKIKLYPSDLSADWVIQYEGLIETYVSEQSDVLLEGEQLLVDNAHLEETTYKIGDGKNRISFIAGNSIMVYTQP
ncbi:hypothetical protein AJ85_10470 [Alkalihalobacillus alcalophilus ATCC 27647 = CGMCC 1.3604]|uniref:LiaF transmembrane domain-containing protein n=1 Tax=Alkalihalobacillus alcalophilus ATCC 27647 = CGMCC 1.3604 TaxID=1218173 RepID=A0A094XAM2_ALKAL|nr:DUF5668 domain-containing protein [Alkalihalobacillus alcalophilus]KGA95815.1 hypothetical protein BALCAV_0220105 [Alkalihalobacillus alcalophilus ATCC 27647 = CGMCC 1.3604]MED1563691.1 hypothetical protein [Alkalihalobacillus alcalophilus]THG90486.1 hypothetical protein AJ85_10470 [Alkalihalobacillus alcalophilus ATCC 27647 = CGMCC 1.3604]